MAQGIVNGIEDAASAAPAAIRGRPGISWADLGGLAGLLVLSLYFLRQVRNFWGDESYYNYGYTVPILAGVLLYWRWKDAPAASPDASRQRWGLFLGLGLLFALVPFRMLAEVNPFWRVPVLVQGLLLVGLGCLVFWVRGGRPLLSHFAFPVLFLLTMLPWPYRIEVVVIQHFTEQVMHLTEAFLLFIGHPAQQSGNALLVGGEKIDVNDACSGIRSIQALAMSALFLGELLRLSLLRRVAVVGVTILLVLFFNSARALALTLLWLRNGFGSFELWHDRIGWITFALSLAVLYLVCELLKTDRGKRKKAGKRRAPFTWGGALLSPRQAGVFFAVASLSVVLSEGWFLAHEWRSSSRVPWRLDWNAAPASPQPRQFLPSVTDILNFDFGEQMHFSLSERREATVFLYGYTGEDRVKSVSTFGHSPIICMAASGIPVKERRAPLRLRADEYTFELQHFIFAPSHVYAAGDLHAFWMVWESRLSQIPPEEHVALNLRTQLKLLAEGRRDFARQVLLVAVQGARNADEAREELRRLILPMITPAGGDV
jgi:exosortase